MITKHRLCVLLEEKSANDFSKSPVKDSQQPDALPTTETQPVTVTAPAANEAFWLFDPAICG